MELQEYSVEELRAELKRRYEEKKKERDSIPRCRLCKHYGTIDYWGNPVQKKSFPYSQSCPFHKTKNGKYFRVHQPSQLACEYFESKDAIE